MKIKEFIRNIKEFIRKIEEFLRKIRRPFGRTSDRGTAEALNHKRGRAHEGANARTYSTARSAVRELNEIARNLSRPSRLSPSKSFDIL